MANTFSKTVSGSIYPAYNDSYVEFSVSSSTAPVSAEIIILPESIFPNSFFIFPDKDGKYLFNYKDAAKAIFEQFPFKDENGAVITTEWGQSITGSFTTLSTTILTTNAPPTGSTIPQAFSTAYEFEFYRSVKQVGEQIYTNNAQINNYSTNGTDYNLTYFEGYPFSFELHKLTHSTSKNIKVKNLNSGGTSAAISTQFTGAFRIIVDKVGTNWTTSTFLPLSDTINRLEILEDDVFKTNLRLKKVPSTSGVYLKWFNNDGGYSFHLFDKFYRYNLTARSIGNVSSNTYPNVGSYGVGEKSIGKSGGVSYRLNATIDDNESEVLKSLFTSPMVQMYSSHRPFVSGEWLDVTLNSNYSLNTKNEKNEISVTIDLPDLITPTL